jgi:hypothetical protein
VPNKRVLTSIEKCSILLFGKNVHKENDMKRGKL